jgi:glyoxylase-like metal-dependent hydrolase (beta-lactamase superfamily II)
VQALILTHGDTDHIGFVAQLSREKGIPATCTRPTPTGRGWR